MTNRLKTLSAREIPVHDLEGRVSGGESFTYREQLGYSYGEPVKKKDRNNVQDLFVYRVTEEGVELYRVTFKRTKGKTVLSEHGTPITKSTEQIAELETQIDGRIEKITVTEDNLFKSTNSFYHILYDIARSSGYAVMEAKTAGEPGYLLARAIQEHVQDFSDKAFMYNFKGDGQLYVKRPFKLEDKDGAVAKMAMALDKACSKPN